MAIPFYNQGDQDIYASGQQYIPQERFRLGYTAPPSIANASTGITNTQAASPYIWSPQGGGGGGGGGGGFSNTNKYGLNLDTQKTITSGKYTEKGGPGNMYGGVYTPTERTIAQDERGNWKDVNTNQNVYHGNFQNFPSVIESGLKMFGLRKGDPYEDTWTGAEWDEDIDPQFADKRMNTIQRWKAKKEFKAKQAEKAAAAKVRANIEKHKPYLEYQSAQNKKAGTGGWQSGMAKDEGFMSGSGTSDDMASFAQGGRSGYKWGDLVEKLSWASPGGVAFNLGKKFASRSDPDEPSENILEFMKDQGIEGGDMASAPHPDEAWLGLWENLSEKGIVPIEIETLNDFKNWFHNQNMDMGSINEQDQGIASLV